MLKRKEFKELLGFDHTWFVILSIFATGVSFPFIFFGDTLENFMQHPGENLLIGITIASILLLSNIGIFYYFKSQRNVGSDRKAMRFRGMCHLINTLTLGAIGNLIQYSTFTDVMSWQRFYVSLAGYVLFASVFIGFYEAAYYMKALGKSLEMQEQLKRQNVESQLEILKNQVKPHFLFNSLNTLASLIPEEPELAVNYVQKLSKVYRYILEIKNKKLIPVAEELDCVKAYLFMLRIRFGTNLEIEIDENELDEADHIVPLSLQLLVENAVKHNVISNKKPLTIKIQKEGNQRLLVSNNLQKKDQIMPSTGTGLANIKSRYEILSKQKIDVIVMEKEFRVLLPLIKVS